MQIIIIIYKQTPTQAFPVDIGKFLRIAFLYNTSGSCFWQAYHGTVKSAGMPVLWFPRAFDFDQKLSRNVPQIIPLLTRDKTISSLLDLIRHLLLISECFGKVLIAFDFDENLHKALCKTSNYVISRVKRLFSLHFAIGWVLSTSGYDLENGTWQWKSRSLFSSTFVYFADLKTIYFASSVVAASCFNYIGPCRWF